MTGITTAPVFAGGSGYTINTGALAVFDDQLLILYEQASAQNVVAQAVGGALVGRAFLGAGFPTAAAAGHRDAMFVDGSNLYCFVYASTTAVGWRCYQVTSSFTVSDITSSVIPLAMTGSTGGGNSPTTSRAWPFIDHEASIGASPAIFLNYAVNGVAGTPFTMYRWNGPASLMTIEDSGGDQSHAIGYMHGPDGGEYAWTSGEDTVLITATTPVSGGVRVSFQLFSATGTDMVSMRAWCSDAATEYPTTAAIFSNPSVGTLTMADTVNTGLTADNGTTTYQVTWVAGAGGNGFANGQRAKLKLEVF
jgi:hypothetical protein